MQGNAPDEEYEDEHGQCALEISRLNVRLKIAIAALTASASKFREYETLHAAKGNLGGDAKARANCEMAELCERAIAEINSSLWNQIEERSDV